MSVDKKLCAGKKKKKIPCDLQCDPCNYPYPVTPLPDNEDGGMAASGFYEPSSGAVVAPGGLVSFSQLGTQYRDCGVQALGANRFYVVRGGVFDIHAAVPVDEDGGSLGLAVGSRNAPMNIVPRTVIHNSGNFGNIQRSGIFPLPTGAVIGLMNASSTNSITIPAQTPDGVQLYQSLQFVRWEGDDLSTQVEQQQQSLPQQSLFEPQLFSRGNRW